MAEGPSRPRLPRRTERCKRVATSQQWYDHLTDPPARDGCNGRRGEKADQAKGHNGSVIIVGAGPGVSGSLARLWADAGHSVGLAGTDEDELVLLADDLRARR
jgi:hypothetical protein